jgi:hypothetical protein
VYSWLHKFELDYQVLVVLVPGPPDDLKCHKGKVLNACAGSPLSGVPHFHSPSVSVQRTTRDSQLKNPHDDSALEA